MHFLWLLIVDKSWGMSLSEAWTLVQESNTVQWLENCSGKDGALVSPFGGGFSFLDEKYYWF